MRAAVRAGFVGFSTPLEGLCDWLYCDVKGLVTTAIGNLVDPIQFALPLPFMNGGLPATIDEIAEEWRAVKGRPDLAHLGGGAYRGMTKLRLSAAGIDQVVSRKLVQNDVYLRARFTGYEEWPADAQLGILSMAWACGPAFRFPMFEAAVRAGDFVLASQECKMNEAGNPGLVPRNAANRQLFMNAARVIELGLDHERLWYPRVIGDEPPTDPEGMKAICPPLPFPPSGSDPPPDAA